MAFFDPPIMARTVLTANTGLSVLNFDAMIVSGTKLYAGGTAGGVFLSSDSGASWNELSNAIGNYLTAFSFVSAGTSAPQELFAGTYGEGIYRSSQDGSSWTKMNNGLSNLEIDALAVSGVNTSSSVIFAGGQGYSLTNGSSVSGGVFRSTDDGVSWVSVTNDLANTEVVTLCVVDTIGPSSLLLAGMVGGVFLSTDSGGSWKDVSEGLPEKASMGQFAVIGTNIFVAGDTSDNLGNVGGSVWKRSILEMTGQSGVSEAQIRPAGMQLYPNPAASTLTIEGAAGTITICDPLGRSYIGPTILQPSPWKGAEVSLDVSSLPAGVYFVSDGTNRSKFVKE